MEEQEELDTQLLWTISGLGSDRNITSWSPVGMSGVAVQTDIFTFPPYTRYPLCLKLNSPILKSSTDRGVTLLDFVFICIWILENNRLDTSNHPEIAIFNLSRFFFIIQDGDHMIVNIFWSLRFSIVQ